MPEPAFDHTLLARPETLGGAALDLRDLVLDAAHLAQEDAGLNRALWAYFPVETTYPVPPSSFRYKRLGAGLAPGPPYDPEEVRTHARALEREAFNYKVELLLCFHRMFGPEEVPPCMPDVLMRKGSASVQPLAGAVRRVGDKKRRVNATFAKGHFQAALFAYMECLFDLMPWFASPLFLTSAQACESGLAELEASLWSNLCIAGMKASYVSGAFLASAAAGFVTDMRYAPANLYYKARHRYLAICKERPASFCGGEKLKKQKVAMLEAGLKEFKDKDSKDWAHRDCITEHVCFSDDMVGKVMAVAASFKKT